MQLLFAAILLAQSPEALQWSNTPSALAGREVEVKLRQGKKIKGDWISVTPTTFTIRSGNDTQEFKRTDIQRIKVSKRHIRGRVIGMIAGYAGAILLAAATSRADNPWAVVVGFGGGTAGYFLGKSFDHDTHIVELLPDDPTP